MKAPRYNGSVTERGSGKPCVVVTACGTATAHGLVRTLRERWGDAVRITGADAGDPRLIAGRALFDVTHRVPLFGDPGFDAAIDAILRDERTAVYRPLIDAEIAHAARRDADGELPAGAHVPWPGATAAKACADKLAIAETLADAGIAAAPSSPVHAMRWDPRGVVTKPRAGFGSIGVRRFATEAEFARERPHLPADHIGQPLLAGPEITVDAVAFGDGRVRAVARERLGVRGGVATKCRVHEDERLAAIAAAIAEALTFRGPFCFQVMHDENGDPHLTDLNARPGGATRMTVVAGVDLLCAPFAELWGLPFDDIFSALHGERHVIRHFEEELV